MSSVRVLVSEGCRDLRVLAAAGPPFVSCAESSSTLRAGKGSRSGGCQPERVPALGDFGASAPGDAEAGACQGALKRVRPAGVSDLRAGAVPVSPAGGQGSGQGLCARRVAWPVCEVGRCG